MKILRMFILTKTTQGLTRIMLKAGLDAHISRCGIWVLKNGNKTNIQLTEQHDILYTTINGPLKSRIISVKF